MKHERFPPSHQRLPWAGTRRIAPDADAAPLDVTVVPGEAELIEALLGAAIADLFGQTGDEIGKEER